MSSEINLSSLGESEIGLTFGIEMEKEDLKLIEINNDFLTYLTSWKEKNIDQQPQQSQPNSSQLIESSSPRKKQKTSSSSNVAQKSKEQSQKPQHPIAPIRIRGESNGEALFCSESNSFVIKRLETSNSIFLLNSQPNSFVPSKDQTTPTNTQKTPSLLSLYGPVSYTMELTSTKPKLEKLFELLAPTAYAGPQEEEKLLNRLNQTTTNQQNDDKTTTMIIENSPFGPLHDTQSQLQQQNSNNENSRKQLYSLEQLSYLVPSSDKELKDALSELGAFDLNGNWRLLDLDYRDEILEFILVTAAANQWTLASLSQNKIVTALEKDFGDRESVIQTLNSYSQTIKTRLDENVHTLDLNKIKIFHAIKIFKKFRKEYNDALDVFRRRKYSRNNEESSKIADEKEPTERILRLSEFLNEWKRIVQEEVDWNLLKGYAIQISNESDPLVIYFPASSLPFQPLIRLDVLFQRKSEWTLDELTPYLKSVIPSGTSVDQFLTKNARLMHGKYTRRI